MLNPYKSLKTEDLMGCPVLPPTHDRKPLCLQKMCSSYPLYVVSVGKKLSLHETNSAAWQSPVILTVGSSVNKSISVCRKHQGLGDW
jgi:hypothetical protein